MMRLLLPLFFIGLSSQTSASTEYEFQSDFDENPGAFTHQNVLQKSCSTSSLGAYEIRTGPVQFCDSGSPSSLIAPQLSHLNSTTGEQWEFDATSEAGDSGLLIAFYRDPEFAFLGPGNLRVNLDIVWPNGTKYSLIDYAEESIIEDCSGDVTGLWIKSGSTYKFHFSESMELAEVWLDTPAIKGSILLTSTTKPRYSDGSEYPSPNASTKNIPHMHWFEPIPAADVVVDLAVGGSAFKWKGIGGSERIWQSQTWFEILRGYKFLRARVGPYSISYWTATSRNENADERGNLFLTQNGKKIFSSSQRMEGSIATGRTSEHFVYTQTFGGNVRGLLKNNLATGYDLVVASPKTGKRWNFHFEHKNIEFEFNLGNSAGGTAFVGTATGGEEGQLLESGVFLNEAVDFTNLWVPKFIMGSLYWYHWFRVWANLQVEILSDMVKSYSL